MAKGEQLDLSKMKDDDLVTVTTRIKVSTARNLRAWAARQDDGDGITQAKALARIIRKAVDPAPAAQ